MTAIVKTADELRAWRDHLIAGLPDGMTEERLFHLGRAFELEPDLRGRYEMLRSIYWLLEEPEPDTKP